MSVTFSNFPLEIVRLFADWGAYELFVVCATYSTLRVPTDRYQHMINIGYTIKVTEHDNEWFRFGRRHMVKYPAVENNYWKGWYVFGVKHCDGGPSDLCSTDTQIWRYYGLLHRENGPACVVNNDCVEYYHYSYRVIDGKIMYGEDEFDGNGFHGTTYAHTWFRNNKLHREDGPAYIPINGSKCDDATCGECTRELWFYDGKLHREGGPALITDSVCVWLRHGTVHRDDGPAVEYANGAAIWYRDGKSIRSQWPANREN